MPANLTDELFLSLQGALAGVYSIERELGRGGMGVVYLAREVRLAREVAIKVLPPALAESGEMRDQFLREAQMAARLSHPNIVPIFRVDEAGAFVYFAMMYVDGETLAQHLRSHGPLAPHRAVHVLREIAWALTYAHTGGIIHRDVKPENILLERGTGRALVTDFGIAVAGRADPAAHADDGRIVGSAHYLSPEQVMGEPVDARSDVYSLGVVAYCALTGQVPFDAPTTQQILTMHLNTAPAPIASTAPGVPSKIARVVERCLAKRPEDRFQSAAEFAEALDATVEVQRDIPAPIRVWISREARERRGWIVAGGYVSIMVFGSLLAATKGLLVPIVVTAPLFSSFVVLPLVLRTRKVLAAGYERDDLVAAMREHWVRRREEIAYETADVRSATPRALFIVAGASAIIVGGLGAVTHLFSPFGGRFPLWAATVFGVSFAMSTIALVSSAVAGVAELVRRRGVSRAGEGLLKFWSGRWGARLVKLAKFGLKRQTPAHSVAQLTEVALGRATDALYQSLPKDARRELKGVPELVQRLERDAKTLRVEIDRLDSSLGALGHDDRPLSSASRLALDSDDTRAQRAMIRADLRTARDRANTRLIETVSALENIRLDLIRLRVGAVAVESVTETMDAARQVSDDLSRMALAANEVELSLRPPEPTHASP